MNAMLKYQANYTGLKRAPLANAFRLLFSRNARVRNKNAAAFIFAGWTSKAKPCPAYINIIKAGIPVVKINR